jgi:protein TonB
MDDSAHGTDRPSHPRRSLPVGGTPDLFGAIAPPPKRRGLVWLLNASLTVHVGLGLALVLGPLYFSSNMPVTVDTLLVSINPPPPPPPPPAKTSVTGQARPNRTVAPVQQAVLTAPRETPKTDPRPVEPQLGLDAGIDTGVPEGMEGGVEGGVVGGVPGGVLGGVTGGTGDGPVLDYDQPPRLLRQTKPQYPKEAFVKRIEGAVELEILIDATGHVVNARVVRGIPLLEAAAIECVKQWVFAPATKNGRPVATLAGAPIRFSLL